jgi:UDP-N-acetyl-D-glucosamine dehydrogenase
MPVAVGARATSDLKSKLADKTARIGIVGLGYVGLPLAMEFCREGYSVSGFELSRERIAELEAGRSYVMDVGAAEVRRWRKSKRFAVSSQFNSLHEQDVLLVCVQTPLRKSKEPDISNILSAIREISLRLRRGQLIVLESTTFPGTTSELVLPILQRAGRLGEDFYLAYSPERVDPGNREWKIANTPKVVGGADPASTQLAVQLYSQIVEKVVPVSSSQAAEVVKLVENSFRSVNIAMVNELTQICHRLNLDVWEILEAAGTKPFGFMPFHPGPGIGGHCIPKDPQLLAWKMKSLNFEPRVIQLASTINSSMPGYTKSRIADALNTQGKALNGSKILVMGVAYKPNIADVRESPALDVMHLLAEAKAVVSYHDPYVPSLDLAGRRIESTPLTDGAVRSSDCLAILTAHSGHDYSRLARLARMVFDARNATRGIVRGNVFRL